MKKEYRTDDYLVRYDDYKNDNYDIYINYVNNIEFESDKSREQREKAIKRNDKIDQILS